jgi:hypothetical protein
MAEVEYLILCDYATTGQGGKQVIAGVFDSLRASNFPCTHPVMFLAARLQGAPHEVLPLRLEVGHPNGEVLQRIDPTEPVVLSQDGVFNMNIQLVRLTFPEQGRYTFKVLAGNRSLETRSLRVLPFPQGGQQSPPARPN